MQISQSSFLKSVSDCLEQVYRFTGRKTSLCDIGWTPIGDTSMMMMNRQIMCDYVSTSRMQYATESHQLQLHQFDQFSTFTE